MIIHHEDYGQLTQTPGHPECPERYFSIMEMLDEVLPDVERIQPEPAPEQTIALAHDETYIDFIKNFGQGHMDADSYIHPHTFEMARLAVGGVVKAAELAYENKRPAYALVRPPGHHAGPDYGGGFCYFNSVAVAACQLQKKVGKVAIIDMDVHHGNGTNDIFAENKNILYISTHQWGIYPGTGHPADVGEGAGEGFNVNIPMLSRAGDSTFELAYDKLIMPILRQFEPKFMIVSYGADAHYTETLASLSLSSPGYLKLISKLLNFAKETTDNRIAFALEGGYNLRAQAEMVCGTIAMFENKTVPIEFDRVLDTDCLGKEFIDVAAEIQKKYWDVG